LWNDTQIEFLKDNLSLSDKQLTELYNQHYTLQRSYDSIQKKTKVLRQVKEVVNEVEDKIYESTNKTTTEQLPNTEKSKFGEQIDKWLLSVSNYFQGTQHKSYQSSESSLCLLLSDLHFGKQTKKFNIEKAKEYLQLIPSYIEQEYPSQNFDEIVVFLDGDIVEGEDIYSTQNGAVEAPVILQTQVAVEALFQLLLDLEATFECRVRVETAYGNHGRMSKTADPRSNWDNVVYMMLSKLVEMEQNKQIVFNLNFEEFKVCQVKDKSLLMTHHGTKHMGTPAMQVKFIGWVLDEGVDMVMHGHWHQWKVECHMGRIMLSNGSLSGPDDLSKQMGLSEPPRQALFLVTPHQPIHSFSFVQF
jgi:hypothetical protein